MRTPSVPSERQPDPLLSSRMYSGATAERTLKARLTEWATNLARQQLAIPDKAVPALVKRALRATVNSIRNTSIWRPGLAMQMLRDQALVYNLQHRVATYAWQDRFRDRASQYVRLHLGRWNHGRHLTSEQERVCEESVDAFYDKLLNADFELTTSLSTFLIGIVKVKINEAVRLGKYSFGGRAGPLRAAHLAEEPMATVDYDNSFYQQVYNRVAAALGQLTETCQQIVIEHYGLDPQRAYEQIDPPESLTDEEFQALFDVAMQPPRPQATSLKELAGELGISPKKISDRHLNCLDRLVRTVIPDLFDTPDLAIPELVRQTLQTRLDLARRRHATR